MISPTERARQSVIKCVQELLMYDGDMAVTPAIIEAKINLVLEMYPIWGEGLDRIAVIDELIRRFSMWVGQDSTLKSDAGHTPWLVAARKKDWRYWQRYREWMEKGLSYRAVEGLDKSTDLVIGLLEDPLRSEQWDRRGLVVGHVQSGKTGHYIGLISKAADAGYKIIIVLAGLHNNLRSQTQVRLDEGFLGYETKPSPDDIRAVGVSEIDGDPSIRPNYATNRANNGDFSTSVARNLGITPEQRPWLFVVKKNKIVLERLLLWIRNHVANVHDAESGRRIVTHLPLLLIDDEADHGSVDTGEQKFDSDGNPDDEHQPKTINRLIRSILHAFSRSAYVGYTATPFANIFIHERSKTQEFGPDLFPSSFIINLAAPSNYVGPARIIGVSRDDDAIEGLPLVRTVKDFADKTTFGGWMPLKHENGHSPLYEGLDGLPPSLTTAINSFILACAVRKLRGHGNQHSSMLVHVTRFNSVQQHVHRQVDERIRYMKQRIMRGIDHAEIERGLQTLWENDFVTTTTKIQNKHSDIAVERLFTWDEVLETLPEVIADIQVRIINGTAKDALDYVENEGTGLKVIAIGGDKLARGLTLEGLCTSYFLRASRMYDTLMQMGRWFGYRPGYLDLCRLYTTPELIEWFGHITEASEELREEFDLMAASGATPREYGLKVKSHSVLLVTSRVKMRTAHNLMLSFSGQLLETVALFKDREKIAHNFKVAKKLIQSLNGPEVDPVRMRNGKRERWNGYLWKNVAGAEVVDFLQNYRTHPDAHKVNGPLLAQYINLLMQDGELTDWTIALIGGGEGKPEGFGNGISVDKLERRATSEGEGRYSIGRLMSPRDEAIDLDEPSWNAALEMTKRAWHADPGRRKAATEPNVPNGPAIRKVRGFGTESIPAHPERAVLFLYMLDPNMADAGLSDFPAVVAMAVSFPGSNSGLKVEYMVNNVLWEQEYGSSE